MYVYIYIYLYTYICIYIYKYIYVYKCIPYGNFLLPFVCFRENPTGTVGCNSGIGEFHTNIVTFRGPKLPDTY